jgi:hypothetical protein
MAPMVGFAATATFRSAAVPQKGSYVALDAQVEQFAALAGPSVVVFQDLDDPAVGATFGEVMCSTYQAFGAVGAPGVASVASDAENASFFGTFTGGHTLHRNVPGSNGIGITNSGGLNMFADPAATYAQFRPCVLGLDNNCGGWGNIRGFNRWNLDATLAKDFRWKERLRVTVSVQFTNVLNHFQPLEPVLRRVPVDQ